MSRKTLNPAEENSLVVYFKGIEIFFQQALSKMDQVTVSGLKSPNIAFLQ